MANPDLAFGALAKPSRFDRTVDKHKRQVKKRSAKRDEHKVEREYWRVITEHIFLRDRGLCRACGVTVRPKHPNPARVAHVHHIVYRSAGGSDHKSNLVLVCARCHDLEHRHIYSMAGNGDELVTVTLRNAETGRTVSQHDSPCPAVDARRA